MGPNQCAWCPYHRGNLDTEADRHIWKVTGRDLRQMAMKMKAEIRGIHPSISRGTPMTVSKRQGPGRAGRVLWVFQRGESPVAPGIPDFCLKTETINYCLLRPPCLGTLLQQSEVTNGDKCGPRSQGCASAEESVL
jgi:hypothetical protein